MLCFELQAEMKSPVQPEQRLESFQILLSRSKMLAVNRQIACQDFRPAASYHSFLL